MAMASGDALIFIVFICVWFSWWRGLFGPIFTWARRKIINGVRIGHAILCQHGAGFFARLEFVHRFEPSVIFALDVGLHVF